ncbi:hypothetical protein BUALT_Bualt05G0035900 [Buddleja alternifolia]|uniref:Carotenoid cleavage dioxygenase 4 n=1 Tax=Buddleja alternifolia TaxID=168488 RepID=A0AAV6XN65_9LAMI|nr:hypothetical protein BUALT_Bualt05G0035900 [Buddleja alternifolia]
MDALSSSFFMKPPHLLNLSSFTIQQNPKPKILANSPYNSTTFHLPKKIIIKHNPQTLKTPKNPLIQKRKNQSLLATIFNSLDDFISTFIDLPLHPSINPKHVLSGNYAPVDELPPTACTVMEGSLPSCLNGAYIRNGPNPQFTPRGPYHVFDGDGMLHMIKISQGKATFCSRYNKTYKYTVERDIGYPLFPSVFSSFNGLGASIARIGLSFARVLIGQFDPITHGLGTANTSLALFSGHIFALCESDLPYAIKVTSNGDIITTGRHHFESRTKSFSRMTAHPKIDQETSEAFAYAYNSKSPFLTFFRINPEGKKQKDVPIMSMKGFTAIHDFAITKNYAIFPDIQIVVNPSWILRGKSPVGVDIDKIPRLGIIPRYAEDDSEMWWMDVPGFNLLHCVNAWEEDGGATVVMVASNVVKVEEVMENMELAELTLEKIIINVKEKTMERHKLSNKALDFAVINPTYAAKKNRYVYAGVVGPTSWIGVVKLDLSLTKANGDDCTVATRLYGPGCSGGEPFFVAREPNNPTADEDDGYLVTYMHDEKNKESSFLVMDAKSPTLDIIATVKLPRRVPNGFHGLFVSESDLNRL